jgi:hypothetical protein
MGKNNRRWDYQAQVDFGPIAAFSIFFTVFEWPSTTASEKSLTTSICVVGPWLISTILGRL